MEQLHRAEHRICLTEGVHINVNRLTRWCGIVRTVYRTRVFFEMVVTGFRGLFAQGFPSYLLKQIERRSIKLTPVVKDDKW